MNARFDFRIAADHPSLPGHFPGRPIVPGVLLLDEVMRGIAEHLGRDVEVLQRVKFAAALWPEETATVTVELVAASIRFSVQTTRDGVVVSVASGTARLRDGTTPPQVGPST